MFLDVQIPLADARPFLRFDSNRLSRPIWANPIEGEFVRGFGALQARPRGGVRGLDHEGSYCEASHAPRLDPSLATRGLSIGRQHLPLLCAFRRILSDGKSVARLEIAFRHKHRPQGLRGSDCRALWESLLRLNVIIPQPGKQAQKTELGNCGRALADYYLKGTTAIKSKKVSPIGRWWINPGLPLIVMEYSQSEVTQPPLSAFQVKRFPEAGFTLHRDHLLFNHKLLGIWLLELDNDRHFDRGVYRDLRVCLSRIHAERECLKETLRLLARSESKNVLALESAAFQKYLIRAAGILLKKQFYGFDRSEILEAAQEFDVMLIPGERETIVSELQNLSLPPTTMNALMELVNPAKQPDSVREVTNNYYISRAREIAMGDINKSNEQSGGAKNITITGSQNINVESTLTNVQMSVGSIAAASDADKKQLENLLKQLNDALKQVPAEKAEQAEAVATQASQLVETAAKDKPNKTMLQVIGNGLRQTADFLKDAIPSAVTIAGQIVSLIGKIHGIPI